MEGYCEYKIASARLNCNQFVQGFIKIVPCRQSYLCMYIHHVKSIGAAGPVLLKTYPPTLNNPPGEEITRESRVTPLGIGNLILISQYRAISIENPPTLSALDFTSILTIAQFYFPFSRSSSGQLYSLVEHTEPLHTSQTLPDEGRSSR